jgi:predicted HicB family RNase H-like nuclease
MAKNITLAIDESVLEEARIYAAKRNTSVNGLVRDFLEGIAKQDGRPWKSAR